MQMSKKIDDQMLMAYVDAELSEADRKEVELFLAGDPKARETVERYRLTRTAIDQFAGILEEPVPEHLIDTIRQHEPQPNVVQLSDRTNAGPRWMAFAASLVIGVGLGAITMNYLVVQPSEDEASITAGKVAELSDALKAIKGEKETAEKNMAIAENKATDAVKEATAANQKVVVAEGAAAAAKSTIDDMAKALKTAQAETAEAQEQVLAASQEAARTGIAEDIESIFPFKLVSEAIENGSKLSAADQKYILDDLNKEEAPTTTASNFSKLIRKSNDAELTTSASQYETLGDLQSVEKPSAETTGSTKEVLGEFTYSGKTCRLIKFSLQGQAAASSLVACRGGSGSWEIVGFR
jgi:anti-sigma factor RsiW